MRTSYSLITLVALVLCCCALPAAAQTAPDQAFEAAGTDARHVSDFLKTLKTAVSVDNRFKVAKLLSYPIEVWAGGEVITLRSESELLARYSKVFTPELKKTIAESNFENIVVDDRGVHIDAGRLCCKPHLGRPDAPLRIVAINKPQ